MLESLPNYDNWKTEPDEADNFDDDDAWLDEGDQRFDDERDADLQRRAELEQPADSDTTGVII